ncbi:MAG: hypothetical protein R2757_10380 [Draconibacterium sp.]
MRKLGALLYLILFYSILVIAAIAKYSHNHNSKTQREDSRKHQSNIADRDGKLYIDYVNSAQFEVNAVDTNYYFDNYAIKSEWNADF